MNDLKYSVGTPVLFIPDENQIREYNSRPSVGVIISLDKNSQWSYRLSFDDGDEDIFKENFVDEVVNNYRKMMIK